MPSSASASIAATSSGIPVLDHALDRRVSPAAARVRAASSPDRRARPRGASDLPSLEQVDEAEVGDPPDGEAGHLLEVALVVERASEHPGRLGEEALPLLGEAAILDVRRGSDPARDRAARVAHRNCPREVPAPVAVGAAQPVLRLEDRAGASSTLPRSRVPVRRSSGWIDLGRPGDAARRRARVLVPALVEVRRRPVRRRSSRRSAALRRRATGTGARSPARALRAPGPR